ncbi:MAG: ice-binding family protein [Chromatiales bacterium]|nr:ice-binding family protein [Chromatiales bacterium]
MTGFGLIMDPSNTFSTSSLVNGKVYAAEYTDPTPAKMTTDYKHDMKTAYNNAAGLDVHDYTELYAGDLTGQTLTHGLYKWGTDVLISAGGVTISGTVNDVWIFQIAGKLILASGTVFTLSGGAQASNIFYPASCGEEVTLGTNSEIEDYIVFQTDCDEYRCKVERRALAETIVTLAVNTAVTSPSGATAVRMIWCLRIRTLPRLS